MLLHQTPICPYLNEYPTPGRGGAIVFAIMSRQDGKTMFQVILGKSRAFKSCRTRNRNGVATTPWLDRVKSPCMLYICRNSLKLKNLWNFCWKSTMGIYNKWSGLDLVSGPGHHFQISLWGLYIGPYIIMHFIYEIRRFLYPSTINRNWACVMFLAKNKQTNQQTKITFFFYKITNGQFQLFLPFGILNKYWLFFLLWTV